MISLIFKLWRYLHRASRIPTLPGGLVSFMDVTQLDDDSRILIMAGLAKDELQAQRLMADYEAVTAWDVLTKLPNKKRRGLKHRLLDWLRRSEGSYEHDPLIEMMRDRPHQRLKVNYRLSDER